VLFAVHFLLPKKGSAAAFGVDVKKVFFGWPMPVGKGGGLVSADNPGVIGR
jgi:hypothetical protein